MDPNQELLFDDSLPENHRSGFVALLGKPNVGKSTLLNAWLGIKIAPVSAKPQTTRRGFRGILTRADAQAIFMDTPGIHLPRTQLGEYMLAAAKEPIGDADVIVWLVDASEMPNRADEEIARLLPQNAKETTLLVLNKIDLVTIDDIQRHRPAYMSLAGSEHAYEISAQSGFGVPELLEEAISRLPLGPRYFPEDEISDSQERYVAAELIREQLLNLLDKEVPHACAVVVDEFRERPSGGLSISANIYTEKDSQKGIVIGRGGQMLRHINKQARQALETFFGQRVRLELWVKVRKNWRSNKQYLEEMGYGN